MNCHFKMKTYLIKKKNFNVMTRAEKVRIIMPCLKKMTFVNNAVKNYVLFILGDLVVLSYVKNKTSIGFSFNQLAGILLMRGILTYHIFRVGNRDAKIFQKMIDIFMKVYKRNNSEKNIEELVDVVESLKIELKKKNEVQKTKKAKKGKTKQNKK